MFGSQDALGLNGRLTVNGLGLGELSLVAEDVASVGQGEDVIGMIRAARTLHAVSIKISKMIGVGELVTVAQDPAQQVGRPERVGVLGLEQPVIGHRRSSSGRSRLHRSCQGARAELPAVRPHPG